MKNESGLAKLIGIGKLFVTNGLNEPSCNVKVSVKHINHCRFPGQLSGSGTSAVRYRQGTSL